MKLLALVLLSVPCAPAQKVVSARAGMVYFAEGALTIDDKAVRATTRDRRPQLEDGQVLGSPRGHAEVLLGPSAVLWTDTQAQVRFDDTRVEDTRISLLAGSAMVEIKRELDGGRIHVQAGSVGVELTQQGLYRFYSSGLGVRVYAGEAALTGNPPLRISRGQELADGQTRSFDRKVTDEFHYWSAYRSFLLESESGAFRTWEGGRFYERKHSGFGIEFSEIAGAARAKYLAGGEAGMVYYLEGSAVAGGNVRGTVTRPPMRLGQSNFIRTEKGRAEVFLGIGVVARIGENTQLRMLETLATNPFVALDQGMASIEVAEASEGARLRIQVGDSVTELLKPGLYQFDAKAATLLVYGGETSTAFPAATIRAKDAQVVNLKEPVAAAKFDVAWKDALFKWAADRSFALYMSPGSFMTGWEEAARRNRFKHKQFGDREDPRARPRLRRRF